MPRRSEAVKFDCATLLLAVIAFALTAPTHLLAEQPAAVDPVQVGIGGIYRVGRWTAIRAGADADQVAAVQTLDGDGVRVRYQQPNVAGTAKTNRWLYAVPGSTSVPLRLFNANDTLIRSARFNGKSIPATMPWIVTFGDPLSLNLIGQNDLLKRAATVAVSQIKRGDDVPDQTIGYTGVDLIVIGPSGIEALSTLDMAKGMAIIQWVRQGGHLLLSLGNDPKAMIAAAPWLSEIVPWLAESKINRIDASAFETYTTSQTKLPTLEGSELPARGGLTMISGRNALRQPLRLAMQQTVGFGRVTVVSVALDSAELQRWPERTLLVSRLVGDLFKTEVEGRRDNRSASTAVAYDDIAGQVRATLDNFDHKRRVPYSVVSLVLLALAALVGPIDYWLVNRILGRPLLGWITFPLSIALVSALFLGLGRPAESAVAHSAFMNRIEIVDIDAKSDQPVGRGWSWAHLSCDDATQADYLATIDPALVATATDAAIVSAPFGHPGSTFGGISIVGEDSRMPSYDVAFINSKPGDPGTSVCGVPLPPGGSKGIASRWSFAPRLIGQSSLSRRRGNELLAGSLTNPLPVDLLNGALVYGEWVYLLPTRIRAGETVTSVESLRQKNFRWLLARREALENSSRSEPWNVEMDDDLGRLAEILMFHSVVGGRDYTGLANRPLANLDLSELLDQETAMLYGELAEPALNVDFPVQRQSVSAVRVLLNVSPPRL